MDDSNKTIAIGEDKHPYQVPLNLMQLATYLEYFNSNSVRELKTIFSKLSLDGFSRKKYGNTIDFKADEKERRQLRIINKGLTMELFAAGIFRYIDHPVEVHSHCLVNRDESNGEDNQHPVMPKNFAQGGLPDITIDYNDFTIILEVSAKYQPSLEDYKDQINGAIKHARSIRENGNTNPIYCVLINERSLKHTENKHTLKQIMGGVKASEDINITGISILEIAELGQTIASNYLSEISDIKRDDWHTVIQETMKRKENGKLHELLLEHVESTKSPFNSLYF